MVVADICVLAYRRSLGTLSLFSFLLSSYMSPDFTSCLIRVVVYFSDVFGHCWSNFIALNFGC